MKRIKISESAETRRPESAGKTGVLLGKDEYMPGWLCVKLDGNPFVLSFPSEYILPE